MKLIFYKARIIQKSTSKPEKYNYPTKEDFINIPPTLHITKKNNFYKGYTEITDEYFWLYIEYNSPNPRRDMIIDTQTQQERENTRSKTEVELSKQGFFLYHYTKQILYIKSYDDKKILLDILRKHNANNEYKIESFYESMAEFMDVLDSIQEIKFADADGLFGELREHLNIDQDSRPDTFSVSLKYEDRSKSRFEQFLPFLFEAQDKCSIKNLLIKGKDSDKFGVIFNQDTFFQKISIEPQKTQENIWNEESVKEQLLKVIHND